MKTVKASLQASVELNTINSYTKMFTMKISINWLQLQPLQIQPSNPNEINLYSFSSS